MKIKHVLIMLVLFLININLVLGAGIGSNNLRYEVEFHPNQEFEFEYQLITTSTQTMDYELYTLNEDEIYDTPEEIKVNFTPYIQFTPAKLKDVNPGEKPSFKAKIKTPEKMLSPGDHGVRICVQETLSSGGTVGSRSGACGRIVFKIPYPGKYLIIGLTAHNTNINKAAKLDLVLNSRGEQDINQITGEIKIFDENKNLVKSLPIQKLSLKSRERKTISSFLDTIGMKPGEYTARAEIKWDEGTEIKEDTFRIGAEKVELLEITKTYKNNTINPVKMKIKNNWNKKTENIFAVININEQELKTPTTELGAWQESTLKTYWDTTGLKVGKYPAAITMHYAGKKHTYKETFTITEQAIETPGMEKIKAPISGLMIAIIIVVIILLILNVFLIYKLTRKK